MKNREAEMGGEERRKRRGRWLCEAGRRRHALGRRIPERKGGEEGKEGSRVRESEGGGSSRVRERKMKWKEGDDVFIYNLGKITINYPKIYS